MDEPNSIWEALNNMRKRYDPNVSGDNIRKIIDQLTALSYVLEEMGLALGVDLDQKSKGKKG